MRHILKSGLVVMSGLGLLTTTGGLATAEEQARQIAIADAGVTQGAPGFWSRLVHGDSGTEATQYAAGHSTPFAGSHAPNTRQQMLFLSLHSLPVE